MNILMNRDAEALKKLRSQIQEHKQNKREDYTQEPSKT